MLTGYLQCAEGIVLVDREVIAISPRPQSKVAILPFKPAKNSACTLRIQTHVATRSLGAQLHVFESDVIVPKFSVFKHLTETAGFVAPTSSVTFSLREPVDRIIAWMQSVFIIAKPIKVGGPAFSDCSSGVAVLTLFYCCRRWRTATV